MKIAIITAPKAEAVIYSQDVIVDNSGSLTISKDTYNFNHKKSFFYVCAFAFVFF